MCLFGATALLAAQRVAESEPLAEIPSEGPNGAAVQFDFDDPPDTKNRLTQDLTFGGKVTLGFDYEQDYDLDRDEDDDLATWAPELEVAFSYDPYPWFRGFLNLEVKREFQIEEPDGRAPQETEFLVKEAFLNFREILPGVSMTLGRQEFKDEREWLYDEDLDAVRLFLRYSDFGLEVSVSREELVDKDLFNDTSADEINNYFLFGRYALGDDSELSPYLFFRDDRTSSDEDLIFIGLSSSGELTSDIDYWVQAAHVRGSEDGTDVSGYGFDIGATYTLDASWEPSLTLGTAFGSGDNDPDDTDRNFRQTGLQDNNDRFNGVTSVKYYGEVLDPELSNLFVLTAGLGIRPTKRSSIDLIYHHYRQHQASDELRDVSIDADPDGQDRTLGNALDLVVGYREIENFNAEAVFGLFAPGAAFSNDASTAYFVGIELEISF
ncbi:alginate export family protein [Pelagibius litoralis]|uniref:Alginate export family protein n=1 Tax=Pelagibius litoralis TaxID=374515 RepID=A0A967KCH7_9PROT|nr:alginate export family protein [Pelagibius litoralis]NIA69675.1 alginate export family protein [Pelagibius litoralis]